MEETKPIVAPAGKYLTFALASEEYGVPVLKVREIIKIQGVAKIKGTVKILLDLDRVLSADTAFTEAAPDTAA